jgi:hypothetical protein
MTEAGPAERRSPPSTELLTKAHKSTAPLNVENSGSTRSGRSSGERRASKSFSLRVIRGDYFRLASDELVSLASAEGESPLLGRVVGTSESNRAG